MSGADYTQLLTDALPFEDKFIDEDDRLMELAVKEVEDEMQIFAPDKDYIKHLPSLDDRPFLTPLLKAEQLSIELQEEREESSRLAHIPIDIPPEASSGMSEDEIAHWEKCLNQVKIKLEYQQRQLLNLDILKTYNLEAWNLYMKQNEDIAKALRKELDDLSKITHQNNWTSKEAQEQAGKTLELLDREWNAVGDKNRMIS